MDDFYIFAGSFDEYERLWWLSCEILEENKLTMNPRKVRHGRTRIKLLAVWHRVQRHLHVPRHGTRHGCATQLPYSDYQSRVPFFSYVYQLLAQLLPSFGSYYGSMDLSSAKGASLNWDDECETSRRSTLINILTEDIMALIYPDWEKQFVLQTDASESAIAAVCGQWDEHGLLRPLIFKSRVLSLAQEAKLHIVDKELLAGVWGVEQCNYYLLGREFLWQTDSTSVVCFANLYSREVSAKRGRVGYCSG
eukprot:Nk52_evm1s674 gene=Nk52_evmTU1s674